MESNNTNSTSNLLARLNRLEEQVSMLSVQLEISKTTISQLNQSLSDRDWQISELEKKLAAAQNSLQKKTIDKIVQCREQIIKGIDVKIVNPVLTQIQKYIETTENLVTESRRFISKKKALLHANINATSDLVHQSPDQAMRYLVEYVVEPAQSFAKKTLLLLDSNYKTGRDWLEQELVNPAKALLDRILISMRELPLDARIVIQMRVLEPASAYLADLPAVINNTGKNTVAWCEILVSRLRHLIQQCLIFIKEQIKKSSFWDGKHRMQAA